MSKFNRSNKVPDLKKSIRPDTVNKGGAPAYKKSAESEFAGRLVTTFLVNSYYEKEGQQMANLVDLIPQLKNPQFALKAAIYARTTFNMRSITQVALCETIRTLKTRGVKYHEWMRRAIPKLIKRPDDILEVLAYWDSLGEKGMPKALQRGLADSFDNFDGHQLKKWANQNDFGGNTFNMIDAIRILHPKGTERNAEALHEFVHNKRVKVSTRQTTAVRRTMAAQDALGVNATEADKTQAKKEARKENWEEIFKNESKVSYFDLLKNLGGILRDAPEQVDAAIRVLTNPDHIKNNKIFPFRYVNAYRALMETQSTSRHLNKVLAALSDALDISCSNVPNLSDTLVVVDVSGSMKDHVSTTPEDLARHKLRGTTPLSRVGAAAIYAAILAKAGYADILIFATTHKVVNYNARDSSISISREILSHTDTVGYGTCFPTIFDYASKNPNYKRIVIFTDEQSHTRDAAKAYQQYKATHGKPWLYTINLKEYGTSTVPQNDEKVIQLAGYSTHLFTLIEGAERNRNILVDEINAISLD